MTEVRIIYKVLLLLAVALSNGAFGMDVNLRQLNTIERNMNTSADPCEDFYTYACGNWEREHQSNDYEETMSQLTEINKQKFISIFRRMQKTKVGMEHRFARNALYYYRNCKAVEEYDPKEYLLLLLQNEHLDWPSLEKSTVESAPSGRRRRRKNKNYDWLRMLAVLRKYGFNGVLLEEVVFPNRTSSLNSLIDLDKPVLHGGFQPMIPSDIRLMIKYLDTGTDSDYEQLVDEIVRFELLLEELLDVEDDVEVQQVVTLAELNMPQLQTYLNTLLGPTTVTNTTKITIQNLPYMRKLFTTLESYEPEMICRYLMIRFTYYLHISGPDHFLKPSCVENTLTLLPLATHWIHKQHHSTLTEDRKIVERIFEQLKEHFMHTLTLNANNLNATLVQFLQNKLTQMQINVGNLPKDTATITEYYQNLEITASSSFYQNHLQLLRHQTKAEHRKLKQTIQRDANYFYVEDVDTAASSSPYYLTWNNVAVVPLSLLHLPIYDKNLHNVFQYSAIGFLLAHEIMHGFDESGIEYDRQGNMISPADDIKANTRYSKSLNCLRDEQPQFIDEKIADVNGLRLAYASYFENNAIPMYTKFDWSDIPAERLFFLNFAQFFCGTNANKEAQDDRHGQDKVRIVRALENFEEFSEVYKCPTGSVMNPDRKCHLWR